MAKRHLEQNDKDGNRLDIYLNDDEVMVGDQTLADKLDDMDEAIEDALDEVSSKANASDVYSKSEVNTMVGGKQDALQFENTPTDGSTKMVKSGGIYTALQNLLGNIRIGANGNWYIGDVSNPNNDTGVKARGVDGITISDPEDIQVVHNLDGEPTENFDHETQVAVMGADVGPLIQQLIDDAGGIDASVYAAIRDNVNTVVAKVNAMLAATGLANIAFVGSRPSAIPELVWPDGGDSPVLTSPQNGSEVNVGTIANDGTSVTKTITVKGKNLESAVNLAVSGTGFSLSANTVSAADANAGTTVTITYTDSGTGDGQDKTGSLIVTSAGSEFTQRTVALKGKKLEPGVVIPIVSLASNEHLELTGDVVGDTYTGVLSVKSASASTKGLPWPDGLSAIMGDTTKAVTYDDSTGAITINGVTADVEITAVASIVDGVDNKNNPVRWKEGLYFNGTGNYNDQGDNTTADDAWCISDYVRCDYDNTALGKIVFGTGVYGIGEHYIIFYDENKQYHSRLSLNKPYRVFDLSQESSGIAYFRISMLINKRAIRFVRDLTNSRNMMCGSQYDGRYDNITWGKAHVAPNDNPKDIENEYWGITQVLPVNFGPGETITFWSGTTNNVPSSGSKPYLFFYSDAAGENQTDKLSCNVQPRSWTSSLQATLPYASLSIASDVLDNCYVKVTRNGVDTFYFAGFNVNTNGNA